MARRKKNVGAEIFERMQHTKKEKDADPEGVTVVLNEKARALVTIGPEHRWWGDTSGFPDPSIFLGAIVRVLPPADESQGMIDGLVEFAGSQGAVAVKVMSRLTAPKVPVVEPTSEPAERRGPREAVLELAREISSLDRTALLALVERTLAEVKL